MLTSPFCHPVAGEISPGKTNVLRPIPDASTLITLIRLFPGFGRRQAVMPHPAINASYAVPVRQYRPLRCGLLQICGRPQHPCLLLTVQVVTPARKGLSPSELSL